MLFEIFKSKKATQMQTSNIISELTQKYEQVKLLEKPQIYLVNHFSELRSELDSAFIKKKKQVSNIEKWKKLQENWSLLLNKINEFEKECIQAVKLTDEIVIERNSQLQIIKSRMTELKDVLRNISKQSNIIKQGNEAIKKRDELICDINFSLKQLRAKMEQILFLNSTIIFLNKNASTNDKIFNDLDSDTTVGKLVLIRNQYFTRANIEILKT
jgi:hypothetical protein